jgi:predicted ATP-dependent serine protease
MTATIDPDVNDYVDSSQLMFLERARGIFDNEHARGHHSLTEESTMEGLKEHKEKALQLALSQIERQFGKGAIMRLGAEATAFDVPVISTGSISLDAALGVGGIPCGRVMEIFGPEASGKTTLALHVIAGAQKAGGIAAFIDAEHAIDPVYAQKLGVKTDELLISQTMRAKPNDPRSTQAD